MGSFNTTCFATHQTIAPNDGVLVFPIYQFHGYAPVDVVDPDDEEQRFINAYGPTEFIYPDALWRPLGCALRGTYDDYGIFALEQCAMNRVQLLSLYETLQKIAFITAKGSNPYHEKSFKAFDIPTHLQLTQEQWFELTDSAEPKDLELVDQALTAFFADLQDAMRSNRVFLKISSQGRQPALLKLAVAAQAAVDNSEDALQYLTSIYEGGDEYEPASEAYAKLTQSIKQWRADAMANRAPKTYESLNQYAGTPFTQLERGNKVMETMLEVSFSKEPLAKPALEFVLESVVTYFKTVRVSLFGQSQHRSMDMLFEAFIHEMAREVSQAEPLDEVQQLSVHFKEEVLPSFFAINSFLRMVNCMSIVFTPSMYASQDYSNDLGKAYQAWVSRTCKAMPRTSEEDEDANEGLG